jgi:hypothetical protein
MAFDNFYTFISSFPVIRNIKADKMKGGEEIKVFWVAEMI